MNDINYSFLNNKYSKWYFNIVQSNREITDTFEKHHIIPKSLGGSNSKENLVKLTPREHFICHLLLTRMTEGNDLIKMSHAAFSMCFWKSKYHSRSIKIGARTYQILKIAAKLRTSEHNKKIGDSQRGKIVSAETKEKLRIANLSKILSDETKAKISKFNKGRIFTPEHKLNLKISALNMSAEGRSNQIKSVKVKSDLTKMKMKTAALARTGQHNLKIGLAHKGIPKSEEQKQKNSTTLKSIKKIICQCGAIGSPSNMKRWHFLNCRLKPVGT